VPTQSEYYQLRPAKVLELSANCRQFQLNAANNRFYDLDCADTKGMFRITQSIPSPKAEPFKRWLAEVGAARLDEIGVWGAIVGKFTEWLT
jgi:hypothetical protein